MALGKKTGGRKKGSLNKTTAAAKQAVEFAAQELGGAARLAAWAKENPDNEKAFWVQVYPKLLPLQGPGENGEHLVETTIRYVLPERRD